MGCKLSGPMRLIAATDGACLGNPGSGGWAWVIEGGAQGSSYARQTINNRMEVRAVLEVLKATDPEGELLALCDSRYVIDNLYRVVGQVEGERDAGQEEEC